MPGQAPIGNSPPDITKWTALQAAHSAITALPGFVESTAFQLHVNPADWAALGQPAGMFGRYVTPNPLVTVGTVVLYDVLTGTVHKVGG